METQFASNLLRSVPPEGVLIVRTNAIFSLWYRQYVLGERPDVLTISADLFQGREIGNYWYYESLHRRYPELIYAFPTGKARSADADTVAATARLAINATGSGRPVVYLPSGFRVEKEDIYFEAQTSPYCDKVPWGITYRLYQKGTAPDQAKLHRENESLWSLYVRDGVQTLAARADLLQTQILRRYALASLERGKLAEATGNRSAAATAYSEAVSHTQIFDVPDRERLKEAYFGLERCQTAQPASTEPR